MSALLTPHTHQTLPYSVADDQASRLRALVRAHDPAPAKPQVAAPHPAHASSAKIIAIASGKGGVGKTNIAVNLSIALTTMGCRVTLFDADLGTANADVLCGLIPGARLEHAVRTSGAGGGAGGGAATLRAIGIQAPGGFTLVPGSAGIARMADLPADERQHLIAGLEELERDADAIIIDTAAGIGSAVTSFLNIADLATVVAAPEPTAIADAYALIKCFVTSNRRHPRGPGFPQPAPHPLPRLALLVNQASNAAEARAVHARISTVSQKFLGLAIPMLGWIAQDPHIPAAVRARRPVLLHSPRAQASKDVQGVARELVRALDLSRAPQRPAAHTRLGRFVTRLVGIGGAEQTPGEARVREAAG